MNVELVKKIKTVLKKSDELSWRLKLVNMHYNLMKSKHDNDKEFIRKQYYSRTGKKLNLKNPVTFNEKLQWLKLYYHNPLLHTCVDKYAVRDYVKKKLDGKYGNILIPCYGVYDDIDEVDFSKLPREFIMKLTNGSSFNYICYHKNRKEIKKMKTRFRHWCKQDYYTYGREWAYKGVPNRIVVEKLLKPSNGNPPEDFRFFCFDGKVKAISVDIDSVINGVKQANYYRNIYDSNWNRIKGRIEYPNKEDADVPKPKQLETLVAIAEKLSEDFPAVRVDLYYFDEKIYFGELTFYHSSGYQNFEPEEFAVWMGSFIEIEKLKKTRKK